MPISDLGRTAALASAIGAAACSPPQRAVDTIPCAHGTAPLAPRCTVERERTDAGLVLTLRDPDGGFRRLLATRDGRGLVAAAGAEPARVAVVGPDLIEVALGGHRYRLPATVRQ
jgi:hypothetical protein